jgi:hypothetical protein
MPQISTQAAFQWFQMADAIGNRDGNITAQEAAIATQATVSHYNLAKQVNDPFATEKFGQQLAFAGTFFMGGAQGQGFAADFDNNGAVSLNEAVRLDANGDGVIDQADFATTFGAANIRPTGNQFTLDQLGNVITPIATGQANTFNPLLPVGVGTTQNQVTTPGTTPGTTTQPPGALNQISAQQAMALLSILSLVSMMGSQNGGQAGNMQGNLVRQLLPFILMSLLGMRPNPTTPAPVNTIASVPVTTANQVTNPYAAVTTANQVAPVDYSTIMNSMISTSVNTTPTTTTQNQIANSIYETANSQYFA